MQKTSSATAQLAESRQFVLALADLTCSGLDIEAVIEILPFEQPTPIPDAPVNVLGDLDIRRDSVPIAELSACLGRVARLAPPKPAGPDGFLAELTAAQIAGAAHERDLAE